MSISTSAMPCRIDQLMAGLAIGDATSAGALAVRDALRSLGIASDLFAPPATTMPAIREQCHDIAAYAPAPGDIALHHFGGWSTATAMFLALPVRKIVIYHNITPGHFFRGYRDDLAAELDASRARLPEIAAAVDAVWADSSYNAAEFIAAGARHVHTLPLPFSSDALNVEPDPAILKKLAAPLTTFLTVCRVAPNKRIEDLMRAFAFYRTQDPFCRLLIVGSHHSAPRYVTYLKALARELQTANICFEGYVWPEALAAYYRLASAFVSTSAHEGYCLPLLEAMHHGIPVIARSTGGVPEPMGCGGLRYKNLAPREIATLMHRTAHDPTFRSELLATQARRLAEVRQRDLAAELRTLITALPDGGPA